MIRILNRPYERYFIRGVDLKGRCSILAGKRGIGKTTTLIQHLLRRDADIQTSRQTLYVPSLACTHTTSNTGTVKYFAPRWSRTFTRRSRVICLLSIRS